MARTRNAIRILDRVTGKGRLRERISRERLHFQVAQMIHDKRTAAGLTQAELAKLVGTTQSVIARLEDADYKGHSLTMLERIAHALDGRLEVKIVGTHPRRVARRKPPRRKTGTQG